LGFTPVVAPANVPEIVQTGESAHDLVLRLARLKAEACEQQTLARGAVASHGYVVVIAADTVIEIDGEILGKPEDKAQGLCMLESLSGREHRVLSGVCVRKLGGPPPQTVVVSTRVKFARISQDLALRYWNSGEPQGKAGAYAIQGLGGQFVEHLSGSYSNVVGLPLFETNELLKSVGLTAL
jgi:septum formation protein